MPDFHHAHTDDPLGLADETGIILVDKNGGVRKDFVEMLAADGRFIAAAVVELKPVEEYQLTYELRDAGGLTLAFGVAVNTNYILTAGSVKCGSGAYPTVDVTALKPSNINKLKAYTGAAIELAVAGGFGMVNKFGATFSKGISSGASVSMQTAEAMEETSGDYLEAGLYYYGFKLEATAEAYDSITLPVGAFSGQPLDTKTSRDGWKTYAAAWWQYLHAHE